VSLRCDHCVAEAVVVSPGTEEVRELFLLARGALARCWCLTCAQAAGWPWLVSEAGKRVAA
jgi:hypothetical protein